MRRNRAPHSPERFLRSLRTTEALIGGGVCGLGFLRNGGSNEPFYVNGFLVANDGCLLAIGPRL